MGTRRLYLIRHGEYDWEDKQSRSLTKLGLEQAKLTGNRISSLPIAAIYSSDLLRAVQTAEIIRDGIGGVPYKKKRNLRECYLPSSILATVPSRLIRAGEKQAAAAFAEYFRPCRGPDKHEVIVSHGNLIRYLVCRVFGRPKDSWMRLRHETAGLARSPLKRMGGCGSCPITTSVTFHYHSRPMGFPVRPTASLPHRPQAQTSPFPVNRIGLLASGPQCSIPCVHPR